MKSGPAAAPRANLTEGLRTLRTTTPIRRIIVALVTITIATFLAAPAIAGVTPPRVHPAKTTQALRAWVYREYPCLAYIIERETAGTWSPTIYNYGGSGAYGWPQALPGDKMRSAGADWRTNPMTQLRWMISYTESRYGGQCAAKSFWMRNRWY